MALPMMTGYTVDDFPLLRDRFGVRHLELDPWGNVIVTPSSFPHGHALAIVDGQARDQLQLPNDCVWTDLPWKVPGGSGHTNVPDLAVLAPGWRQVGEYHLDPPPLLVLEVASPSTMRIDRTRKLDDYRLGGARLYVRVDLPAHGEPVFEVHDFAAGSTWTATGGVDVVVGGQPLRFDLGGLPRG